MNNNQGLNIGKLSDQGPMDSVIGRGALWDVVLTDEEISAIAAGARPTTIRPANLVALWPIEHER